MTVQTPIINNHSNVNELVNSNIDAREAVSKAIMALRKMEPLRNDYIDKQGNGSYHMAVMQHYSRLERLSDVLRELEIIGNSLLEMKDG